MKFWTFLILLAISSACAWAGELRFTEPKLKIILPDDWKIISASEYLSLLQSAEVKDKQLKKWKVNKGKKHLLVSKSKYASIAIKHRKKGALKDVNESDIINMIFEKLKENYSGASIITPPNSINLGGLAGSYGASSYIETYKGKSQKVLYEAWVIDDGDSIYSISIKSKPSRSKNEIKNIRDIIESIQFGE